MQDHSIKNPEPEVIPLNIMFEAYCRLDAISDAAKVDLLPLSQLETWLTSAKILDRTAVTMTDVGTIFFKFRKRAINFTEFLAYLEDLASAKGLDHEAMRKKLETSGKPIHPRDMKIKPAKK